MMAEIVQGDHYSLGRNPRYYRAREGLPYLDKVVFRTSGNLNKDSQAGTIDSAPFVDFTDLQPYQRLYTILTPLTSASYEALYFNFHNTGLANHPEAPHAMAMAIDHPALIPQGRRGFAPPPFT